MDEDRNVQIASSHYGGTPPRIIDVEGNEYVPQNLRFGSQDAFKEVIPVSATVKLLRGIATKVTINYEVPQNISKLAVIELDYKLGERNECKTEFRDIDITGTTSISTPQRQRQK
ncbi:MAG: hypothetical protein H0X31_03300 [Nostocaceae cyanobacterium]|nr:hypothetical protein [Nostocaceae cyanobacterium]